MKKVIFGMVALLLMASCSGKRAAEKAREDSIRIADSLAQIEAAKAEEARLDSLRQDSIKRAELEALNINLFVTPFREEGFGRGLEIRSDKQISKSLTNLGFSENKSLRTRYEEICGEYQSWKSTKYVFTKSIDNETIIVENEDEVEIIFPNAELKDKFMSSVTKAGYKKSSQYSGSDGTFYQGPSDCYYRGTDITVQGNKVVITIRSEC